MLTKELIKISKLDIKADISELLPYWHILIKEIINVKASTRVYQPSINERIMTDWVTRNKMCFEFLKTFAVYYFLLPYLTLIF